MNGYHDVAGRVVFLSSRRRSSIVGVTGNIQQIGIRGRGWCCKFHLDVLHSVVIVSWVAGGGVAAGVGPTLNVEECAGEAVRKPISLSVIF